MFNILNYLTWKIIGSSAGEGIVKMAHLELLMTVKSVTSRDVIMYQEQYKYANVWHSFPSCVNLSKENIFNA